MKHFFHLAAALLLLTAGARGSVTLQINSAGWGNATTANVNGMAWGIIISSDNAGFGGSFVSDISSALVDFSLPAVGNPSTPVQIGSTGYYFARGTTDTSNSGPPTFADGFMGIANLNLTAPVGSGDAIGLLWFPTDTSNGSTVTDISTTPGLATNTIGVAGVPEPGRVMLALLGLLGLTLRRRR